MTGSSVLWCTSNIYWMIHMIYYGILCMGRQLYFRGKCKIAWRYGTPLWSSAKTNFPSKFALRLKNRSWNGPQNLKALEISPFYNMHLFFLNRHRERRYGQTRFRETLTHWGRMTHICVCKLTVIGSDTGLSPGRGQVIIRTNAGILSLNP